MRRRKHSHHNNREGWEFSLEVKKEAKKRSGLKGYTETHHKVWISWARKNGVAPYIIKSIANAIALRHDEHLAIHSKIYDEAYFINELQKLKETYIGGFIFLLNEGHLEPGEIAIFDSKLGEQRIEKYDKLK